MVWDRTERELSAERCIIGGGTNCANLRPGSKNIETRKADINISIKLLLALKIQSHLQDIMVCFLILCAKADRGGT